VNGIPHEPESDRSSVCLCDDGLIYLRTPDCGVLALTPERATELGGRRLQDLLKVAVLDCRGGITLKTKGE
jgi:hypothetical protein